MITERQQLRLPRLVLLTAAVKLYSCDVHSVTTGKPSMLSVEVKQAIPKLAFKTSCRFQASQSLAPIAFYSER